MTILKHLIAQDDKKQAISEYRQLCRALSDATSPLDSQTAPQPLWDKWYAAAQRLMSMDIDPLEHSNRSRP